MAKLCINTGGYRLCLRTYAFYSSKLFNYERRPLPSLLRANVRTVLTSHSCSSAVSLKFDSVISPNLSIDEKFSNLAAIEENAKRRNITLDAQRLHSDYLQFLQLEKEKLSLEQQRREIADIMKHVVKEKGPNFESESSELKRRGKLIREKLKQLQNERYYAMYQQVVSDILSIPVDLHPSTPPSDVVCFEFGKKPEFSYQPLNHLSLGQNMKLMSNQSDIEGTYYLLNEAAILEHHLMNRVTGNHLRSSGLQQFACPDMVKRFIVEGCGFDANDLLEVAGKGAEKIPGSNSVTDSVLGKSQDHTLLLTGVSCFGFAAYLAAMNIQSSSLPLKYYSTGRNYVPAKHKETGLYSASQASSAAVFGAASSASAADEIFEDFLSVTLSLYKSLSIIPFRVVQIGAGNLRPMESKRIDFYVWSTGFNRYFKSGELRLCKDYISRRLRIFHHENNILKDGENCSNKNVVHTIDGIIIKIPSIIASLMEFSQNKDGTCLMPRFN